MFVARVLLYLIRLAIYRFLNLLRFLTKPGMRLIVPAVLIGATLLTRPLLHEAITAQLRIADPGYEPERVVLDMALVILVAALILVFVVTSKLLAVVMGTFPLAMRPLPPQRRLEASKTEIRPAVVRIVVPPLPRR